MGTAGRLLLSVELELSGASVQGVVRSGDGPGRPFAGWTELFAVIQAVAPEGVDDAKGDGTA